MTPQQAATVLELALPTEPDAVKRAFREKARARHPDHGGTSEAFREVTEARDVLLRNPKPAPANPFDWAYQPPPKPHQSADWFEQAQRCPFCGGFGGLYGHALSCPRLQQQRQAYAQAEAERRRWQQQANADQKLQEDLEKMLHRLKQDAAQADQKLREDLAQRKAQKQSAAEPKPEPPRWWRRFARWRKE